MEAKGRKRREKRAEDEFLRPSADITVISIFFVSKGDFGGGIFYREEEEVGGMVSD